jgi:nitrogen fixation/metabolism regulation signal transduction histidine kinase
MRDITISADEVLMRQAISNLLQNAIEGCSKAAME